MERTKTEIFKHFKRRMNQKKISQKDLVEIIGVSRTTLHRNFKGDSEMPLSTYLKICEVLDLEPILVPTELNSPKYNYLDVYRTIHYK
jgi:DNA-binding Xre family transcriptional regulator